MLRMANYREIELKLAIQPVDTAMFRRLALLHGKGVVGPRRRKVFDVYFDTPELALNEGAMMLQLRKVAGKWWQTRKAAGVAVGGLHQRAEWEYAQPVPQIDLALFRKTPLGKLAQRRQLHLTLKPAFSIEYDRITWLVEISPGQRVEISLDQGVIRCEENESPISEVEIELKEGSSAAVFDIACALVGQIALNPEILSKGERGYRLRQPPTLGPRHAKAVKLKPKWSLRHANRAIIAACLDHFGRNIAGALASEDPEYIHQLRLALRRLRSALRIFRPAEVGTVAAELIWLDAALGETRDWDVLIAKTLPRLLGVYGDAGLANQLLTAGIQKQADARQAARDALASPRAALWVLAFGRLVNVPGELTFLPHRIANTSVTRGAEVKRCLTRFAAHEIHRRHHYLVQLGTALEERSESGRHRVRIHAKRLCDAVDFFSSLFGKRRGSQYATKLGEILHRLGETNDDAVAMALIESQKPPERFLDFAKDWFATRSHTILASSDHHIAKLKSVRQFWR